MKFQSLISIPSISSLSLFLLLLSPQKTTAKQVRSYNLTISQRWQSDFGRPVFAINDQSPGPVLEADEGDEFEILVDNQLAVETTLHWHGIYQVDRPWNDGVPGVTQYSIQPRDTYTYRFTIQGQYGIYFYHGHFGPAFADGMRGPIWIRPAAWRPRPYTLISTNATQINGMKSAETKPFHIVISDWNAEPMDILLIQYRDTGFVPWCSTAITLNNKGRTICHSADTISESDGGRSGGRIPRNTLGCQGQAKTEFTNVLARCKESFTDLEVVEPREGEEWVWINFIHSGAHHELQVSVDEHEFYVVAADGEFVHPQKVVAANVNLGERISILVPLNQKPGDYAIRVTSLRQEQMIVGFGILRYPGQMNSESKKEVMKIPQTKPWVHLNGSLISPSSIAMDETKLHPYPARPPPQTSDNTLRFFVEQTGTSSWALNIGSHQAFRQQLPPLLWHKDSRGKTTYTDGSTSNSQHETGKLLNGTVVDIVFENGANVNSQHPFHKHNHKAFIIGTGSGYFPWKDVAEAISEVPENFNLIDPPIRDGCRLDKNPGDWTVVRYEISFPAASMLHCHMIHHFAAGQQVVILEGIEAMESIPEEMENRVHSEFRMPIRYGPLD